MGKASQTISFTSANCSKFFSTKGFPNQATLDFAKSKAVKEYARLLELFGSDEAILEKLNEEFDTNSNDWLQAGFIAERKK